MFVSDIEKSYKNLVADGLIETDLMQLETLKEMMSVIEESQTEKPPWLTITKKLLKISSKKKINGMYVWGGVGTGKTFLMDLIFKHLPSGKARRLHFHRFMQSVHNDLKSFQGSADPIKELTREWSRKTSIVFLDEFFVTDITDAMILGNLLEGFLENSVMLVLTSNIYPGDLYKNGLQRSRFIPAISLLLKNYKIINLDGGVDYRRRSLESQKIFEYPVSKESRERFKESFLRMMKGDLIEPETLSINNRKIPCQHVCEDLVWFHFQDLCGSPTSQLDYIEIANLFGTVFLEELPIMDDDKNAEARRFISLIDEFYDSSVKIIILAESSIKDIYKGKVLAFEFQRTLSRLNEMQSVEFFSRAHKS